MISRRVYLPHLENRGELWGYVMNAWLMSDVSKNDGQVGALLRSVYIDILRAPSDRCCLCSRRGLSLDERHQFRVPYPSEVRSAYQTKRAGMITLWRSQRGKPSSGGSCPSFTSRAPNRQLESLLLCCDCQPRDRGHLDVLLPYRSLHLELAFPNAAPKPRRCPRTSGDTLICS